MNSRNGPACPPALRFVAPAGHGAAGDFSKKEGRQVKDE